MTDPRPDVPFPLPGDLDVNTSWLTELFHQQAIVPEEVRIEKAEITDLQGNRGFSGAISKVVLTYNENLASAPKSLILKMTMPEKRRAEAAREGLFYKLYGSHFPNSVPDVIFSHGDADVGSIILMKNLTETLDGVNANFLFGNQVWGIPEGTVDESKRPSQLEALKELFLTTAEMNAKHWNDKTLLENKWMKAIDWYSGSGREKWENAYQVSKQAWEKTKSKLSGEYANLHMSESLVAIIDQSWAHSSWEATQEYLHAPGHVFALCHGDFHGSNMFWSYTKPHLRIYDWSEIGIWEPCADLGQPIISDVKPSVWKGKDLELVKLYWDRLIELGVSSEEFPFDRCLEHYRRASIERWIWLFCLLGYFDLPDYGMQYFHDQLNAFVQEHGQGVPYYVLKSLAAP